MKFPYRLSAALVGTAATIALVQHQIVLAKTAIEVRSIAEAITVRIDGPGSERNNGSGVIIERQSNTYTVITAAHVVDAPGRYTISTSDGRRYTINSSQVRRLPGVDLATLQFTSNRNYPVARKGNSDEMRGGMTIYASGWYNPGPVVPERIFDTANGRIVSHFQPKDGYALAYRLDVAQPGMSGGPVLDSEGRLIAINGRAERDLRTMKVELITGIPINTFERLQATEVESMAEKITVLVSYSLKSAPDMIFPTSAGVLLAKEGTTYYALTHQSVIPPQNQNLVGSFYVDYDQQRSRVINIRSVGAGLALLQFTSNINHEVARVEEGNHLEEKSTVYIAGWQDLGRSPRFILTRGEITNLGKVGRDPMKSTNATTPGMRGGPVFDERGSLVGIHKIGDEGISIEKFLRVASPDIQSLLARQRRR